MKDSAEALLGWQRKPGPTRAWRVIEASSKTPNGKTLRISIQEIPEDRHEDVLKHMLNILASDELTCVSLGVGNNAEALADFRKMCEFVLQQGIVVGAFLVDENNPKPLLVGAHVTLVKCEASKRGFEAEKSRL